MDSNPFGTEEMATLDLREVINTPAGFRVLLRLVFSCGYGFPVGNSPEAITLHNAGCNIADSIAEADPQAFLRLCESLRIARNTQQNTQGEPKWMNQ